MTTTQLAITQLAIYGPDTIVPSTCIATVGELRSGVTGFATIYATGSHRFLVQLHVENLSHKNNHSNLAKNGLESTICYIHERNGYSYKRFLNIYMTIHEFNQSTGSFLPKMVLFGGILAFIPT